MKLIDKDALVAEIEKRRNKHFNSGGSPSSEYCHEDDEILGIINSLEVKEVDLKKLGEIARHLIAVKEHIEDIRLDKEEWFMIEKIGYPEKFKAQKEEEV